MMQHTKKLARAGWLLVPVPNKGKNKQEGSNTVALPTQHGSSACACTVAYS
jgi:hypothetical protein